ncbi:hypothetical protein F5Y04DRAFT_287068 [Hypomontagnella monticulosa]|nr:hypothetical protein F5Y04DRAFT_287068 [Hypomontagnella monticulosa]
MASYLYTCQCGTRLSVPYRSSIGQSSYQYLQETLAYPYTVNGQCPACGRPAISRADPFMQLPGNQPTYFQPCIPSMNPYHHNWRQGLHDGYYYGLQQSQSQPYLAEPYQQRPSDQQSDWSTPARWPGHNVQGEQDANSNVLPPGYGAGTSGARQFPQETAPASPSRPQSADSMYPWPSPPSPRVDSSYSTSSLNANRVPSDRASHLYRAPEPPAPANHDIYARRPNTPNNPPWTTANGSFSVDDPRFWANSRRENGAIVISSDSSASSSSGSSWGGVSMANHHGSGNVGTPVNQVEDNTTPASPCHNRGRSSSGNSRSSSSSEDDDPPLVFTDEGQLLLLGDAWIVPTAERAREIAGPTRGRAQVRSTHETVDEDGNAVVVDIREEEMDCDLTMSGAIRTT